MELKLRLDQFHLNETNLLIVPYGIETNENWYLPAFSSLLIVPYGIETRCVG